MVVITGYPTDHGEIIEIINLFNPKAENILMKSDRASRFGACSGVFKGTM